MDVVNTNPSEPMSPTIKLTKSTVAGSYHVSRDGRYVGMVARDDSMPGPYRWGTFLDGKYVGGNHTRADAVAHLFACERGAEIPRMAEGLAAKRSKPWAAPVVAEAEVNVVPSEHVSRGEHIYIGSPDSKSGYLGLISPGWGSHHGEWHYTQGRGLSTGMGFVESREAAVRALLDLRVR